MGYRIAVLGATGNVGREILKILVERNFPADEIIALASKQSIGKEISLNKGKVLKSKNLDTFDFRGIDIVLSSPGAKVAARHVPRAAIAGCIVIDNTSYFRMEPDIPLVVPEVNEKAIASYVKRNIIANPNCSTIQMVVALQPLHNIFQIRRVIVSSYQSTSGAGKDAMNELLYQTRGILENRTYTKFQKKFSKQIAFNVIPQIDIFMDNGATREEWKIAVETRKILDTNIVVHANCCRVPVFVGHAEYVNIETVYPIEETEAYSVLKNAPGVIVIDHRIHGGYITPLETVGEDAVYISRLRKDQTVSNGLSFWCTSDNLRKGAALNAVQIAEILIRDYLN